jgi:hypothetical protein
MKIWRITILDIVNNVRLNSMTGNSDGKRKDSLHYVTGFDSYNLNCRAGTVNSVCLWRRTNIIVSHYLTTEYMKKSQTEINLFLFVLGNKTLH